MGATAGDTLGTTGLDDDVFHSTALTLIDDGSPLCSEVIGYVDGVDDSMALEAGDEAINTISDIEVRIGEALNGGGHLDGVVDEARISSIARSADWIKAEFFAQSDNIGAWGATEIRGSLALSFSKRRNVCWKRYVLCMDCSNLGNP